jgi:hypothetical protein
MKDNAKNLSATIAGVALLAAIGVAKLATAMGDVLATALGSLMP